jgi:hypothetical protein
MPMHNSEHPEAIFRDRVMAVEVYKSQGDGRSLYDAARFAWRENREIIGVFVATKWLPATLNNFPQQPPTPPKRIGFVGVEASLEIRARYCGRLVPVKKRGKRHDFHYHGGA